jgi:AraC-like DNA-binding protein
MSYDPQWLAAVTVQALRRMPSVSLKALARACGVSRHTLARALKAETALSYRELQNTYRRAQAEALLGEKPSLSIKESAYELGFAAPRSFTRWLKHTAGCTPAGLRRALHAHAPGSDAGRPRTFPPPARLEDEKPIG